MANPRPIGGGLQGLQLAYGHLAQSNAIVRAAEEREEARRKAQDSSQLRMLGTVGGAIIGGVAAGAYSGGMGAPAGAAIGSQIGGAVGGMVSASRGNENYNAGEVSQAANNYAAYDQQARENELADSKLKIEQDRETAKQAQAINSATTFIGNISKAYGGAAQTGQGQSPGVAPQQQGQADQQQQQQSATQQEGSVQQQPQNQQQANAEQQSVQIEQGNAAADESDAIIRQTMQGAASDAANDAKQSIAAGDYENLTARNNNREVNRVTLEHMMSLTDDPAERVRIAQSGAPILSQKPTAFNTAIGYDKNTGRENWQILKRNTETGKWETMPAYSNMSQDQAYYNYRQIPAVMDGSTDYQVFRSDRALAKLNEQDKLTAKQEQIKKEQLQAEKNNDMLLQTATFLPSPDEGASSEEIVNSLNTPGGRGKLTFANSVPTDEQIGAAKVLKFDFASKNDLAINRAYRQKANTIEANANKKIMDEKEFAKYYKGMKESENKKRSYENEFVRLAEANGNGNGVRGLPMPNINTRDWSNPQDAVNAAKKDFYDSYALSIDNNAQRRISELHDIKGESLPLDELHQIVGSLQGISENSDTAKGKLKKYEGMLKRRNDQLEIARTADEAGSKRKEQVSDRLHKELVTRLNDFMSVESKVQQMSVGAEGKYGGIGDVMMIYAYGKMLDPPSVIRESEADMYKHAGGTAQSAEASWNKIKEFLSTGKLPDGALFTPETRAKFKDLTVELWEKSYKKQRDRYIDDYIAFAEQADVPIQEVVPKSYLQERGMWQDQQPAPVGDVQPPPAEPPAQQPPPPVQQAPKEDMTVEERLQNMPEDEMYNNILTQ